MIAFVHGPLAELWPTHAVIESHGVGYEIQIPLSTYDRLPQPPAAVTLLTHLQVREDAHILYGFFTKEERDLFRLLIHHVSGIGPKMALSILSGMPVDQFRNAVVHGDITLLSKIKGVGKKTAERVVVELRDKVGVGAAWETRAGGPPLTGPEQAQSDAVLALISLGYKSADAARAVQAVRQSQPDATIELLLKEALRQL